MGLGRLVLDPCVDDDGGGVFGGFAGEFRKDAGVGVCSDADRGQSQGVLDDTLGQIEPGAYAELVFLGGNLLEEIDQAANVRQVMANGGSTPWTNSSPPTTSRPSSPTRCSPVPDHPFNAKYWWHGPHYLEESKHACCAKA